MGPMKDYIRVMKALSDPNRVKILKLLQHRPGMCVCEIQALLEIAQPTVSKHLKTLEDAGLVDYRKDGLWVNYALADGTGSPYAGRMLRELHAWLAEDPSISALVARAASVSRERICRKA
jgi:ArsR family transcriptional regulator